LRHHFCQIHLQPRALDALPFFFAIFFQSMPCQNGSFFPLDALPKEIIAGHQVNPFPFNFPRATAFCTSSREHFLLIIVFLWLLFVVLNSFWLGIRRGAGG
jgi:ABC-type uncharacterized transport system permease subunit